MSTQALRSRNVPLVVVGMLLVLTTMKTTAMAQADGKRKTVARCKLLLITGGAAPEPFLIYSLPMRNGP